MVIKNTILNITSAPGTFATTGYVAKIIGTAPRNPTHEINQRDFKPTLPPNGNKLKNTLNGRPTTIINSAINNDTAAVPNISCGFTKSPKHKNITIWHNHDSPSIKV